ncbi:MAG: tRNA (adenosine(37)-N6)-threonylcarbamoyltransferase complex dimerization subunit type 1 TsaB [Betaproteobacteria bacterium]|nr:tRNA (adenosine(37)-N6)-threonylcarbamoyltransferase complex dimerization subunit type 1 TsaB [Betaproteobacteria bacterium]
MKILALDTSSEFCSAAVLVGAESHQLLERAGQRHSQLLIPMVERVLADAGLALSALDGIAVSVGPGTFTGLRIAASVAQGLAFGADLPVAGVGTLDAIAWSVDADAILVCTDARMGEVYFVAFTRADASLATHVAPCVRPPDAVPVPANGLWHGAGGGFAVHAAALTQRLRSVLSTVNAEARVEARHVASLARARHPDGFVEAPESLVPLYVRDKVALTTAERSS